MELNYKTVELNTSDTYTVKKSEFIGYIKPVTTQEQAQEFIAEISKKHWDATHNVYAYIIRQTGVKRFSDDGEPQGTAGIPVLDVLEKNGLTDCCVVVTRYFGGIMLGAGGLVRAYSHTASLAVSAGKIITMSLCAQLEINCDYTFYGRLSSLIPECGGTLTDTVYESDVKVIFRMPLDRMDSFSAKLTEASNGRYSAVKTDEFYAQV